MHTEKAIDSKNGGVFIDIQSIRQGSINDTAAQNEPKVSLTDCAEFIRTRKMSFIAGAVVAFVFVASVIVLYIKNYVI